MTTLLALLAILLFVGVIRAQAALILLASLLLVGTVLSALWSHWAPRALSYRRAFEPPRIFPGEETTYVVEITNDKRLPLPWAEFTERVPSALVPQAGAPAGRGEDAWQRRRTVSLGWYERLRLRQRFTSDRRGEYLVGPTDIETGDPLGLFPVHTQVPESRSLVVYPRLAELDWRALRSRFPFGPLRARPPMLQDPVWFAGIRDYRPGDPRRWVDWKATARRLQLQTRVFTPTTLNNLVVALNVQTMPFAWQGYNPAQLEAAIGVASTLVLDLLADRCSVGFAANGSGVGIEEFQVFLPPSRRPSQAADALGILARLAPVATLAFGPFLRRVAAHFPYGASLAAVAAYLDEESAEHLSALADRGHAVTLFYIGSQLPHPVHRDIPVVCLPEVTFRRAESATQRDARAQESGQLPNLAEAESPDLSRGRGQA